MTRSLLFCISVLSICWFPSSASGVILAQIDDFETETTEGWGGGGNIGLSMTVNTITGGPSGAGDAFLEVSTSSFHLATHSVEQWTGDYLGSGVTRIEMDVNVFSYIPEVGPGGPAPAAVQLRLLLWGGDGGVWTTSTFSTIIAGSGWGHIGFSLAPDDLTHVQDGSGIATDTLSDVTRLMIRHDGTSATPPGSHPPHSTSVIGIDNIEAVPEPGNLLLVAVATLLFTRQRRRD